jgi:hypothetical protein
MKGHKWKTLAKDIIKGTWCQQCRYLDVGIANENVVVKEYNINTEDVLKDIECGLVPYTSKRCSPMFW